jgi:hypothetical protein
VRTLQQLGRKQPMLQDGLSAQQDVLAVQRDGGVAHPRPNIIAYSLTSGAVALVIGALASLTASSMTARVTVWCVVTGATSFASGLARDSATVSTWWFSLGRWMRGPARP